MLELYNTSGGLKFNVSTDRTLKLLLAVSVSVAAGSVTIPAYAGTLRVFWIPAGATLMPAVTISGSTLSWTESGPNRPSYSGPPARGILLLGTL